MARSSTFTPEAADTIVHLMADGAQVSHACRTAGTTPATYYSWLRQARRGTGPTSLVGLPDRAAAARLQGERVHQGAPEGWKNWLGRQQGVS